MISVVRSWCHLRRASRFMRGLMTWGASNLLPAGANHVQKILLVADGYDSEVLIDQVVGGDEDAIINAALLLRVQLQ